MRIRWLGAQTYSSTFVPFLTQVPSNSELGDEPQSQGLSALSHSHQGLPAPSHSHQGCRRAEPQSIGLPAPSRGHWRCWRRAAVARAAGGGAAVTGAFSAKPQSPGLPVPSHSHRNSGAEPQPLALPAPSRCWLLAAERLWYQKAFRRFGPSLSCFSASSESMAAVHLLAALICCELYSIEHNHA